MKTLISITLILSVISSSCKKNSNSKSISDDQLSDLQIQIIEAAGIDTVSTFNNAIFSDGSNISSWGLINDPGYVYTFNRGNSILTTPDKISLFKKRMIGAGDTLTNYYVPTQSNGLAYVYNSKYVTTPSVYTGPPSATCTQPLYGLDCSGMIYQMARGSGINLPPGGTKDYVKTNIWNTAFNNSTDFQGLEMLDLQVLSAAQLQEGDIIVAPGVHIGFVFNNGSTLEIFNSLGKREYTCSKNSDKDHGPVKTKNIQQWLSQTFGSNYHVLRVELTPLTIGTQKWMRRNLEVTRYRNGDIIPQVTDANQWSNLTTGAWCYYNNDSSNGPIYGKLYNWYAVNDPRGLAPTGWHVPTDAEWTVLETFLGGSSVAGGKMKESSNIYWTGPNTGATNSTGFSGLPSGTRTFNNSFIGLGINSYLWSSTDAGSGLAVCRILTNTAGSLGKTNHTKYHGFTVRCIKN